MIVHAVLFRPKVGLSAADRRDLVDAFSTAIKEITSIKRARIGRRTLLGRSYEQQMRDDYTHAAFLEFDDVAGLRAYLDHSSHEELAARFFACFEQVLIYDFETTGEDHALDALLREG
jgi:hypothetical protein